MLCYLMASHCNPMAFNFRIPSFLVAFIRVRQWAMHYASSSATRGGGGYSPPIGLSTKLQNKKNTTFLALLILFFALE